ncbi:MAG: hypothetical protein C0404_03465 [Verrucomicrobia bacterium]|nr:hypothetical protein [Verrucomicrobiota bacterium]
MRTSTSKWLCCSIPNLFIAFTVLAAFVLIGGVTRARAQENGEFRTGLIDETPEGKAWLQKHCPPAKKIRLNTFALDRVNKHRKARGLPEHKASDIGVVPMGQEAEFEEAGGAAGAPDAAGGGEAAGGGGEPSGGTGLTFVDNSPEIWFPPIRSQGSIGSCVSWGIIYYTLTYEVCRLNNWNAKSGNNALIFSPKWTYNLVNAGIDAGSNVSTTFGVLMHHGAATWSEWPYDSNYRAWCLNPDVWRNALRWHNVTYVSIPSMNTTNGIENLKNALANGNVCPFATYVSSWKVTTVSNDPATTNDNPFVGQKICPYMGGSSGGHVMTFVGFSEDIWCDLNSNGVVDVGEKGAFKVANSWGTGDWNSGYRWVAYDAFLTSSRVTNQPGRMALLQSSSACYYEVVQNYQPDLYAKFTVNHPKRNQMKIELGLSASGAATPTTYFTPGAFNYRGGAYALDGTSTGTADGTFYLDFGELAPASNQWYRFWILPQDSTIGSPLTLKSFSIVDKWDREIIATDVLPANGIVDATQGKSWIDALNDMDAPLIFGMSVSPTNLQWNSNSWIDVTITNLDPGACVNLDLIVDADRDKVIDPTDRILSRFTLWDGQPAWNGAETIPYDRDSSVDGSIHTRISYHGIPAPLHGIGSYIWRVTDTAGPGSGKAAFTVSQPAGTVLIKGLVKDFATSNPVPGACVSLKYVSPLDGFQPAAWTDTNGQYTLYLPAGVSASAVDDVVAWASGYDVSPAGLISPIVSGQNIMNTIYLGQTGPYRPLFTVSGHVYDEAADPVPGARVRIVERSVPVHNDLFGKESFDELAVAVTDTNGFFTLRTPPLSSALLTCDDPMLSMRGLMGCMVQGFAVATNVPDVELCCLFSSTTVMGSVTDADSGAPLVGARVETASDTAMNSTYTLPGGLYELGVVISNVLYDTKVSRDLLMAQRYAFHKGSQTNIPVPDATAITGADLTVKPGCLVSGNVYDRDTSARITMGAEFVRLSPTNDAALDYITDVGDAGYRTIVPSGTYHVVAFDCGYTGGLSNTYAYAETWVSNSYRGQRDAALPVTVRTNGATIDFRLPKCGMISGFITNAGGVPGDMYVDAEVLLPRPGQPGTFDWTLVDSYTAIVPGAYTLFAPTGMTCRVHARGSNETWLGQYYLDRYDYQPESATLVTTLVTRVASNINFSLRQPCMVSGIVSILGVPVSGLEVSAEYLPDPASIWQSTAVGKTMTAVDGSYSVDLPALSNCLVVVRDPVEGSMFTTLYWSNVAERAQATLLSLPPMAVQSNTDFSLIIGMRIEGRVLDPLDSPVKSAWVEAYYLEADGVTQHLVDRVRTDTTGWYTMVVPGDTNYFVRVPLVTGTLWPESYWSNRSTAAVADFIPGATGTTVSNVDFKLSTGFKISGKVTDETGAAAPGVNMHAQYLESDGTNWHLQTAARTDVAGAYSLVVPAGTGYIVRLESPDGQWTAEMFYSNRTSWQQASPVSGAPGSTVSNINFQLTKRYLVNGLVCQSDGVTPVAGGVVDATDLGGNSHGQASADGSGWYSLYLPVQVPLYLRSSAPGYKGEYYSNSCTTAEATTLRYAGLSSNRLDFALYSTAQDSDVDGVPDWQEDTMPDGIYNPAQDWASYTNADTDGDLVTDDVELAGGTNPRLADTDGDGMSDKWELDNALDPIAGQLAAKAANVAPTNNEAGVAGNAVLGWAGHTTSYNVYLGTASNGMALKTNTTAATYNPGLLAANTNYYWRIDCKNSMGIRTGDLWRFTTERANLAITNLSLLPAGVLPASRPFTAVVHVWNSSSVPVDGAYLDAWTNLQAAATGRVGSVKNAAVGSMAPGQTRVFTLTGITAPATNGFYRFRAFVDSADKAPESDEADNQMWVDYEARTVTNLVIAGPAGIGEGEAVQYNCWALYGDATSNDVSTDATWTETSTHGSVNSAGLLTTLSDITANSPFTLTAAYGGKTVSRTVTITNSLMPDFVIDDISMSPTNNMAAGRAFTAYVRVKNIGQAAGDGGYLEVWTNRPGVVTNSIASTRYALAGVMGVGSNKTFVFPNVYAPANFSTNTFRAFIDRKNTTVETNENNNQAIYVYESMVLSNLAVYGQAAVGESQTAQYACWAFDNRGNSNDVTAYASWSENSAYATVTTGGLLRVTNTMTADGNCTVTASWGGRTATRLVTLQNTLRPDFVATQIRLVPGGTVAAGRGFAAYVTVTNQGPVAGDAGYLMVWTNRPTEVTNNMAATTWAFGGTIGAGQSKTYTFGSITAPSLNSTNTFRAFVDRLKMTAESEETNNQATVTYVVKGLTNLVVTGAATAGEAAGQQYTCTAYWNDGTTEDVTAWTTWSDSSAYASINTGGYLLVTNTLTADSVCTVTAGFGGKSATKIVTLQNTLRPDFVVTQIRLVPGGTVPAGRPFAAYVTVTNQGPVAGDAGYLMVWTNRPTEVTNNMAATTWTVGGTVGAGLNKTYTFSSIAAPSVNGTNTFRAFIDRNSTTAESDETNNQATLLYVVKGLSNLVVTGSTTIGETEGRQYTCTAYWNDGTTEDVTAWTTWTESSAYASITAGGYLSATNTLLADSVCTITAGFGGKTATRNVTIQNTMMPDFTVISMTISPTSPVLASSAMSAYVTVRNQGLMPGDAGYLDVWTNRAGEVTNKIHGNAYSLAGVLQVGSNRTYVLTGLYAPASNGAYTMRSYIDSQWLTAEHVETNNQATLGYAVRSVTNLVIVGTNQVPESSNFQYAAQAYFSDGAMEDVTAKSSWSQTSLYAAIGAGTGRLTTQAVTANQATTITARFGGKTATLAVTIRNQ